MRKIAFISIAAISTLAFTIQTGTYAFFEKANENYLLLKDSTYMVAPVSVGHSPGDLELQAEGAKVFKKNDGYVVYTDQKNDVTLSVWNIHTKQKLYTKTFKVYSSPKQVKEDAMTNTIDRSSFINRRDVNLKAGAKTKFIYTTNAKVDVVCNGGTVSEQTENSFAVTPRKDVTKITVMLRDTYGPCAMKEYTVVK